MQTIKYPNESLPGPVAVAVDLPDGWHTGPAPTVAFAAVSDEEVAGVYTNVVVAIARVDEALEIPELGEMIAADLAEIPGAAVTAHESVDLDGTPGLLRVTEFDVADVGAYQVIQVATLAKIGDGVADVVTVTVTLSRTAPAGHVEDCRRIACSLRVGDAA